MIRSRSLGRDSRVVQGPSSRLRRRGRTRRCPGGPAALLDPGALADPLVVGVHEAREPLVGHDSVRDEHPRAADDGRGGAQPLRIIWSRGAAYRSGEGSGSPVDAVDLDRLRVEPHSGRGPDRETPGPALPGAHREKDGVDPARLPRRQRQEDLPDGRAGRVEPCDGDRSRGTRVEEQQIRPAVARLRDVDRDGSPFPGRAPRRPGPARIRRSLPRRGEPPSAETPQPAGRTSRRGLPVPPSARTRSRPDPESPGSRRGEGDLGRRQRRRRPEGGRPKRHPGSRRRVGIGEKEIEMKRTPPAPIPVPALGENSRARARRAGKRRDLPTPGRGRPRTPGGCRSPREAG